MQWLEFAAVVSFITLIGWCMWDDIGAWFNAGYEGIAECAGCLKGRIVPGCPLHDPQERLGRNPEAASPIGRAEAS